MSVKFRLGFDITGETLFAMLAKMLPIENLKVEELGPWPITGSKLLGATPQADRAIALHQKRFPKPATPHVNRRASPGPSLTRGINMIIVTELEKGPKREVELRPKVKAAGFSSNSTSSRLESLRNHGIVERSGVGVWRLKTNV